MELVGSSGNERAPFCDNTATSGAQMSGAIHQSRQLSSMLFVSTSSVLTHAQRVS